MPKSPDIVGKWFVVDRYVPETRISVPDWSKTEVAQPGVSQFPETFDIPPFKPTVRVSDKIEPVPEWSDSEAAKLGQSQFGPDESWERTIPYIQESFGKSVRRYEGGSIDPKLSRVLAAALKVDGDFVGWRQLVSHRRDAPVILYATDVKSPKSVGLSFRRVKKGLSGKPEIAFSVYPDRIDAAKGDPKVLDIVTHLPKAA